MQGHDDLYSGSVAQYYDLFFPELDEQEITFWQACVESMRPYPALELGVGTGRVLLPLLAKGLAVEGVDASAAMLELCRAKVTADAVQPSLYQQQLQELDLPQRYGCIYSPLGTWQHIVAYDEVQEALRRCYAHLIPGGKLVLYTYLPWYNAPEYGHWYDLGQCTAADGVRVDVQHKSVHDPLEQCIYTEYRYTVTLHDGKQHVHTFSLPLRWYSRYELHLLLAQAGFVNITFQSGYDGVGSPEVIIVQAQRPSLD